MHLGTNLRSAFPHQILTLTIKVREAKLSLDQRLGATSPYFWAPEQTVCSSGAPCAVGRWLCGGGSSTVTGLSGYQPSSPAHHTQTLLTEHLFYSNSLFLPLNISLSLSPCVSLSLLLSFYSPSSISKPFSSQLSSSLPGENTKLQSI